MVIRVLATQIAPFKDGTIDDTIWESIKFAVVKASEVKEKDYQSVFNFLLHKLLNDKAQCWVRLDEERKLLTLAITEIQIDKITGVKFLIPHILYSWRHTDNDRWIENFAFIKEFAKKQQCKRIVVESHSPRMWELYGLWGFKESMRRFILEV